MAEARREAALERQLQRAYATTDRIREHLEDIEARARLAERNRNFSEGMRMPIVLDNLKQKYVTPNRVNELVRRAEGNLQALRERFEVPSGQVGWFNNRLAPPHLIRQRRVALDRHYVPTVSNDGEDAASEAQAEAERAALLEEGTNPHYTAEDEAAADYAAREQAYVERMRRGQFQQAIGGNVGRLTYDADGGEYQSLHSFHAELAEADLLDKLPERIAELFSIKGRLVFTVRVENRRFNPPEYRMFDTASDYTVMNQLSNLPEALNNLVSEAQEDLGLIEGETGSGWALHSVVLEVLEYVVYDPLRGGDASYVALPQSIVARQACINFRNRDSACFKWAVLCGVLHTRGFDFNRLTTSAEPMRAVDTFDWSSCDFPMPLDDRLYRRFEKDNPTLSLNVLSLERKVDRLLVESWEPIPLYGTRNYEAELKIDVLYYKPDGADVGHYVYVKNLSRLAARRNDEGESKICHGCLQSFNNAERLEAHRRGGCLHRPHLTRDDLPDDAHKYVTFKNNRNAIKHPVVIYADFECTTGGCKDEHATASTERVQKHEASGFMLLAVSKDQVIRRRLYTGPDAAVEMHKTLDEWREPLMKIVCQDLGMRLSPTEYERHEASTECYLCHKGFEGRNYKVRDHDHFTGKYQGPACNKCNLERRISKAIPVFFHNLKGYDGHLILKTLESGNCRGIFLNFEKALTFTEGCYQFKDSLQFLQSSLDANAKALRPEQKAITVASLKAQNYSEAQIELLLQKGVFPYDWFDSLAKLDATGLPSVDAFFSKLDDKACSAAAYAHAQAVWAAFDCETFRDYHNLYLQSDVLLLADVFETFRNMAHESYGLDPVHYISLASYSWDAMLKMTKVTLELLTDIDQHLFFERMIRGGVSSIMHRHAKANNPYMAEFDSSKPTVFLSYVDANNLYGGSMRESLPTGGFQWEDPATFDWKALDAEGPRGCALEVDLAYPVGLHDLHSDYPLAPEAIQVDASMLSPLQREWLTADKRQLSSCKKLVPNLRDKSKYVLHSEALKLYVKLGLVVTKVHRILSFEQSQWLRPYIDFNTRKRQAATCDAATSMFKLMNNAVYGKTMENVRNRTDIRPVGERLHAHTGLLNTNRLRKLTGSPLLKAQRIINEKLVLLQMHQGSVMLNKPLYVGACVLDLSKVTMYRMHYEYMLPKYGVDKCKLLFTDTDSLAYRIETADLFEDMYAEVRTGRIYDLHKYPRDFKTLGGSSLYDASHKDEPGFFKDELKGQVMTEFAGNRAKSYAYSKC